MFIYDSVETLKEQQIEAKKLEANQVSIFNNILM